MKVICSLCHSRYGQCVAVWLVLLSPLMAQDVQLGPNGPVIVDLENNDERTSPKTGVVRQEANEPRVSTIQMRPMAEPVPALKHVLVPEYLEVKPGNAAPYYYRAIMRLDDVDSNTIREMQALEELAVQELVSDDADRVLQRFSSVLSELRIAVHRERCDWDWRLRDRTGQEQVLFVLEEIQEMRTFGRLLSLKVGNHLAKKEFDAAVKTLMVGYRMARDVGEPDILVNDLVGIAIASTMNQRVVEFINTPGSPNLYWALASLPRPLVSMRDGFQHERAMPYQFFPFLRDPEDAHFTKEEWRRVFEKQFSSFVNSIGGAGQDNPFGTAAAVIAAAYPRAKRELIQQGFAKDKIDSMAVAQVIAIHESRVLRRLSDDLFKWLLLPYHEADGWVGNFEIQSFDVFADNGESLPIGSLLLPAVASAAMAEVRLHVELDGLRAVEAIRMQMAKGGRRIPAALEDVTVVPVPINPSTNRPFVYRPMPKAEGRVLELIPGKDPAKQTMWKLELIPGGQ